MFAGLGVQGCVYNSFNGYYICKCVCICWLYVVEKLSLKCFILFVLFSLFNWNITELHNDNAVTRRENIKKKKKKRRKTTTTIPT